MRTTAILVSLCLTTSALYAGEPSLPRFTSSGGIPSIEAP